MTRHLARLRTALRRDNRAVAAVEMALVSTFLLIPLCAFTVEAGQALLTQYKLSRGLHAGLMYAWAVPTNITVASIQTAAVAGFQLSSAGTYGSTAVTATPQLLYYCIDPTTGIHTGAPVAAGTTCSTAGYILGTWVSLALTTSIPTIFPVFGGSSTWSLNVSGTVRIQ